MLANHTSDRLQEAEYFSSPYDRCFETSRRKWRKLSFQSYTTHVHTQTLIHALARLCTLANTHDHARAHAHTITHAGTLAYTQHTFMSLSRRGALAQKHTESV